MYFSFPLLSLSRNFVKEKKKKKKKKKKKINMQVSKDVCTLGGVPLGLLLCL